MHALYACALAFWWARSLNPWMSVIAALWLPILVSAVFVFIVSSVVHMVLPIHKGDAKKLPSEDSVLDAMRQAGIEPGHYMFPCPSSMKDMSSPAMKAKFARGPVGSVIMRPNGDLGMGKALLQWFLLCILIGTFVAYLSGHALPRGAESWRVFRFTGIAALLGHAFWCANDSIWKGIPWVTTFKFFFDGVLYALATGATFAWLWPK